MKTLVESLVEEKARELVKGNASRPKLTTTHPTKAAIQSLLEALIEDPNPPQLLEKLIGFLSSEEKITSFYNALGVSKIDPALDKALAALIFHQSGSYSKSKDSEKMRQALIKEISLASTNLAKLRALNIPNFELTKLTKELGIDADDVEGGLINELLSILETQKTNYSPETKEFETINYVRKELLFLNSALLSQLMDRKDKEIIVMRVLSNLVFAQRRMDGTIRIASEKERAAENSKEKIALKCNSIGEEITTLITKITQHVYVHQQRIDYLKQVLNVLTRINTVLDNEFSIKTGSTGDILKNLTEFIDTIVTVFPEICAENYPFITHPADISYFMFCIAKYEIWKRFEDSHLTDARKLMASNQLLKCRMTLPDSRVQAHIQESIDSTATANTQSSVDNSTKLSTRSGASFFPGLGILDLLNTTMIKGPGSLGQLLDQAKDFYSQSSQVPTLAPSNS
jgi:hypothetical protein